MQTLKVRAAHTAMVPDFEALEDGVMRFVGRRFDPAAGGALPERKRVVPGVVNGKPAPVVVKVPAGTRGGWVPTEEVYEVPFRKEYLDELRAGALLPADAETAEAAGVPFPDPAT